MSKLLKTALAAALALAFCVNAAALPAANGRREETQSIWSLIKSRIAHVLDDIRQGFPPG